MTSALPASAEVFRMGLPIDCDLGETCFIQQFVDHDHGPASSDFTCNGLSYDGHTGTDFALPSLAAMQAGVAVVASATGWVTALRDGMPDTGLTPETAGDIDGRDCGNGVVIAHANGWQTQYCHLMQGSVAVTQGQTVQAGDRLGLVGLSGNTEFPHVHLALRRSGQVVDPFDPDGQISCGAPDPETLWTLPVNYMPGALLNMGFATAVPDYDSVKAGTAAIDPIARDAPALVLWGFAFGGRQGDSLRIRITGPGGSVVDHNDILEKDQAQFFRAAGRRTPQGGWPEGRYDGLTELIRAGRIISQRQMYLDVR
ncbi:MAG: M23 family metallopeptidase [Paracoccaceae bacterium]|uniref:M23 family metallopeptidase n=1 Tax=Seohaeicola saemankumensis TaxID=481181 RepID=UPI001E5C7DC9|nr:M23 family metallopeptidase [Seohaeicola saemankumensis]